MAAAWSFKHWGKCQVNCAQQPNTAPHDLALGFGFASECQELQDTLSL